MTNVRMVGSPHYFFIENQFPGHPGSDGGSI